MDTTKLREAIAEMQKHRNMIDAALVNMQAALAMLGEPHTVSVPAESAHSDRTSYITDTVAILEDAGNPLHMSEIMAKIVERRGSASEVRRNSVEASINRHITKSKGTARLCRVAPSTYALAGFRQTGPLLINQVA